MMSKCEKSLAAGSRCSAQDMFVLRYVVRIYQCLGGDADLGDKKGPLRWSGWLGLEAAQLSRMKEQIKT